MPMHTNSKRNFLLAIPEWLIDPMEELRQKLGYRSRTQMLNDLAVKACQANGVQCDEPVWRKATHVEAVETPEMLTFLSAVGKSQIRKAMGAGEYEVPDIYAIALTEYQKGNVYLIQTISAQLGVHEKTLANVMNSMGWDKRRIVMQNDYPRMLWVPPFTAPALPTRYEDVRSEALAAASVSS